MPFLNDMSLCIDSLQGKCRARIAPPVAFQHSDIVGGNVMVLLASTRYPKQWKIQIVRIGHAAFENDGLLGLIRMR